MHSHAQWTQTRHQHSWARAKTCLRCAILSGAAHHLIRPTRQRLPLGASPDARKQTTCPYGPAPGRVRASSMLASVWGRTQADCLQLRTENCQLCSSQFSVASSLLVCVWGRTQADCLQDDSTNDTPFAKAQAVVLCAAVDTHKTTACTPSCPRGQLPENASSSLACVYSDTQDYCLSPRTRPGAGPCCLLPLKVGNFRFFYFHVHAHNLGAKRGLRRTAGGVELDLLMGWFGVRTGAGFGSGLATSVRVPSRAISHARW